MSEQKKIEIVFFGTHTFAAQILEYMLSLSTFDIKQIIARPDRPIGRKQVLTPPPTKVIAQKHDIPVLQPNTLKNFSLPKENYDIGIVVQYGAIIPKNILEAPKHGLINIHTSLLPKYRGASPIQSALLHGDTTTGVTIMKMDAGLDTGPILSQKDVQIAPDDMAHTVEEKLISATNKILETTITAYIEGTIEPQEQNDALATHCTKISRDDGQVQWNSSATHIYNQYRAYTPWPGIWTNWHNERVKLLAITPTIRTDLKLQPGELHIKNNELLIGTQDTPIKVTKIQVAGKPAMDIQTFLHGYAQKIANSTFS